MRSELLDKTVLAMYDVRGIQDYIFRTNQIKEIIGASIIVDNIIISGMNSVIDKLGWEKGKCITEWENSDTVAFLSDDSIRMQVLFIGGGNAYVLFRKGEDCQTMNQLLSKYVLENTYSLKLAVAVVPKRPNYMEDYKAINAEMRKVKGDMPDGKPLGALPFMQVDSMTGFPLTKVNQYDEDGKLLSTESALKRKAFTNNKREGDEKILDNLVTQKGDNSILAVVHIDGNNMGRRLMGIMEGITDYTQAACAMRRISRNIDTSFKEAYQVMDDFIGAQLSAKIDDKRQNKLLRDIILAGDDVTFICNSKVALEAVIKFIREVSGKVMYSEDGLPETDNLKKYAFSACAGIAFFHSHFPFSDAYQVAEACCASAKKRAKEKGHLSSDGNIGSYIDYQICTNISAADLDKYREKIYKLSDEMLIRRPYYISDGILDTYSDLNNRNTEYDIKILRDELVYFTDSNNIPRSQAKQLRDECSKGKDFREAYKTFLISRDRKLPPNDDFWYDALEIMDLYVKGDE